MTIRKTGRGRLPESPQANQIRAPAADGSTTRTLICLTGRRRCRRPQPKTRQGSQQQCGKKAVERHASALVLGSVEARQKVSPTGFQLREELLRKRQLNSRLSGAAECAKEAVPRKGWPVFHDGCLP